LKNHQITKKERSKMKNSSKVKPTMGGLFFIPIGVIVGVVFIGKTSEPVNGSIVATLAFGAIGLLDDVLRGAGGHAGLPGWLKLIIQVSILLVTLRLNVLMI
jgi:phospho-N-acetylmuramoyl-pentapeptide-transferase